MTQSVSFCSAPRSVGSPYPGLIPHNHCGHVISLISSGFILTTFGRIIIKTVTRITGSAESGFSCLFFFFLLFRFGCAGSSLLPVFSSCGEWGLLCSCGVQASHCSGFSCCRVWVLGTQTSVIAARGLSCSSWALEHRLNSRRAQALLLQGMWNLPGSGIEPVFPALAGRFFTTEPPGKPSHLFYPVVARVALHSFLWGTLISLSNSWALLLSVLLSALSYFHFLAEYFSNCYFLNLL